MRWHTRFSLTQFLAITVLFSWLCCPFLSATAEETHPADLEFFERRIRPLLVEHCYECHSQKSETLHGGLLLDSATGLLQGGDSGPAVVPHQPEQSLLMSCVQYADDGYQMPPQGKLPDKQIADLRAWISKGAPYPAGDNPEAVPQQGINMDEGRKFWSFQPVFETDAPSVQMTDWPDRKIDFFLLSAMEQAGLTPSSEADRATLLRRITFDLTGLPPTIERLHQFLQNNNPNAYEQEVDYLLSTPQYGERWARHWLDLARYTDKTASWLNSTGQAYHYRDWVVQSLNQDMPYDEFVRQQLAADMISENDPRNHAALSLLGLSPTYWKELQLPSEIIKVIVADEWEERVDVISRTFLGLTVACARCHDHKYDPITSEDYYALAGVMASIRLAELPMVSVEIFAPIKAARQQVQELEAEIAKLKKEKPLPEDTIKDLEHQIAEIKSTTAHYDTPMVNGISEESLHVVRKGKTAQEGTKLEYHPEPQNLNRFIRGNPNRPAEVVPRRFLEVLATEQNDHFQQGSGRLELANAILNDAQALTARVMVNRIWHAHFGQGLVQTPSNFGQLGERPSHPELLDDLSARFISNGWSLKWLHREIVLSAAYRQSSRTAGELTRKHSEVDPNNRLLWRMNRRRLEIEAWRDAMLAISGQLDLQLGGPSVDLESPDNQRRTLYATIHRRDMSTLLLSHDFPDPTSHSPQRLQTTTALQGLFALNGPLLIQQAEHFSARLQQERSTNLERIERAYQLLYSRLPSDQERQLGLHFLTQNESATPEQAWQQYAHALLISNEFLFLD